MENPEFRPASEWLSRAIEDVADPALDKVRDEVDARLTEVIASTRKVQPVVGNGPVQLWLRNPWRIESHLVAHPFPRFVVSRAALVKEGLVGPYQLLAEAMPHTDFEYYVVQSRHAFKFTRAGSLGPRGLQPVARIPVWRYGAPPSRLIQYAQAAQDSGWEAVFVSPFLHGMRRIDTPNPAITAGKVMLWVREVAQAFPAVRFHLHGSHTMRSAFGLGFASADFDPMSQEPWSNPEDPTLLLPNGRKVLLSEARKHLKWLHAVGFSVADLRTAAGRTALAVASTQWAAENYSDAAALGVTLAAERPDPLGVRPTAKRSRSRIDRADSPDAGSGIMKALRVPPLAIEAFPQMVGVGEDEEPEPYEYVEPVRGAAGLPVEKAPAMYSAADKIVCDSCSLADTCRYVRAGGVCIVPSSEMSKLASMFGTRNVVEVREGLQQVLGRQATRYETIAEAWEEGVEEIRERPTKEVIDRSKHLADMETSLLRGAEALIKILDPAQRTPAIGVNVNVPALNSSTTHIYNPAVLVADVVRRLEERGYDRAAITPGLVAAELEASGSPVPDELKKAEAAQTIEGEVF